MLHLHLPFLPLIDHSMLILLSMGVKQEIKMFVGCGLFGVIKFQPYRGIQVAVKKLFSHTRTESLRHIA